MTRSRLAAWLAAGLCLVLVAACTPTVSAPQLSPSTQSTAAPAKTAVATSVPSVVAKTTTRPATSTPAPTPRPAATPAASTPAASAGWAALVAVWERDLWLLSADGKRQQRLSDDGGYGTPRAAPDGRRIAYVRGEGLQAEIGIVNADGTGRRLLTSNTAADLGPVWSPDGRTLAFTRIADTNKDGKSDPRDEAEVWLMDADGANARRLTAGRDPAWAPEGLRLVFATNGKLFDTAPYRRDNAINLINARGENEWSLVTVAGTPTQVNLGGAPFGTATILLKSPVWRPDGSQIAFTTNGHTGLVLTITTRATDLRMLDANYEGGFGRAVWSPAGDLLAYESFPPSGMNEVVVFDPVGQRVGTVGGVRRNLSVAEPAWSPDGKTLAFAQLEAEPYLGTAARDTANPQPILWGRARTPDWLPKRP